MARYLIWSKRYLDDRGVRHRPTIDALTEQSVSLRLLSRAEVKRRREADKGILAAHIRRRILGRRAMKPHNPWLLGIVVLLVPLIPVNAWLDDAPWPTMGTVAFCASFVCMIVGAIFVARRSRRADLARLRSLPPACLACRYDLAGIPKADDGCTVCPECGAAWDFDAIDREI